MFNKFQSIKIFNIKKLFQNVKHNNIIYIFYSIYFEFHNFYILLSTHSICTLIFINNRNISTNYFLILLFQLRRSESNNLFFQKSQSKSNFQNAYEINSIFEIDSINNNVKNYYKTIKLFAKFFFKKIAIKSEFIEIC